VNARVDAGEDVQANYQMEYLMLVMTKPNPGMV
jgi:hypothetical protein